MGNNIDTKEDVWLKPSQFYRKLDIRFFIENTIKRYKKWNQPLPDWIRKNEEDKYELNVTAIQKRQEEIDKNYKRARKIYRSKLFRALGSANCVNRALALASGYSYSWIKRTVYTILFKDKYKNEFYPRDRRITHIVEDNYQYILDNIERIKEELKCR